MWSSKIEYTKNKQNNNITIDSDSSDSEDDVLDKMRDTEDENDVRKQLINTAQHTSNQTIHNTLSNEIIQKKDVNSRNKKK